MPVVSENSKNYENEKNTELLHNKLQGVVVEL